MHSLFYGSCLDILPDFDPATVNLIIADLPYGITPLSWDEPIPLAPYGLKCGGSSIPEASSPYMLTFGSLPPFWPLPRKDGFVTI